MIKNFREIIKKINLEPHEDLKKIKKVEREEKMSLKRKQRIKCY